MVAGQDPLSIRQLARQQFRLPLRDRASHFEGYRLKPGPSAIQTRPAAAPAMTVLVSNASLLPPPAGKIDAATVWKLDRWERSSLDALPNIRALESCGGRFIAISGTSTHAAVRRRPERASERSRLPKPRSRTTASPPNRLCCTITETVGEGDVLRLQCQKERVNTPALLDRRRQT